MKIIFIDIDTLRPDHMSCYGYHRKTTPNMDTIAQESLMLENCFASDTPCLPSRAALNHGRFGIKTGAIDHGNYYADPVNGNVPRGFQQLGKFKRWVDCIKNLGYKTISISSFGTRHDSYWSHSGYNEIYDCGKSGMEAAHEVIGTALNKIEENKDAENFFLHFHIWDPHTPYRTPESYGNPFEKEPVGNWYKSDLLEKHKNSYGMHSANYTIGAPKANLLPREVFKIDNLIDYKKWVDGYDVGIHYADYHIGLLIKKLKELNLYEDTAIIITSDHGENQGELNIYGDHQTADLITHRVPMIIKWQGVKAKSNNKFYYQFDVAASIVELLGGKRPEGWDAQSFKDEFQSGEYQGRNELYLSHGPWSLQRSVIWEDYIYIHTYLDGLKELNENLLFNWKTDPHELEDLSHKMPEKVIEGSQMIMRWSNQMVSEGFLGYDPIMGLLKQNGPYHTTKQLHNLIKHYQKIDRPDIVTRLIIKYAGNPAYDFSKD